MNPQDSAWALDENGDVQPLETMPEGLHGFWTVTSSEINPESAVYCDEYWIANESEDIEPKVSFTPE